MIVYVPVTAGIETLVPDCAAPPFTSNVVVSTPESGSAAVSASVTGRLPRPAGASSVVVGAWRSIRTVALRSASTLPAVSVERYVIVCVPCVAGTFTVAPVWVAPPSSSNVVVASPEPPASVGESVTVVAPACHAAGASSDVTGSVSSIRTLAVCQVSRFPAASRERYSSVWTPSPETVTGPAYGCAAPPSSRNSVWATPEPPGSPAVSVTATSPSRQPAGASSVVAGAVLSTRTEVAAGVVSALPAASVVKTRRS